MRPCAAGVTLLCGLDGSAIGDPARDYKRLSSQIAHHVDWQACIEALSENNAVAALELGPGTALSRIAASLLSDFPCRSVEDFRTTVVKTGQGQLHPARIGEAFRWLSFFLAALIALRALVVR